MTGEESRGLQCMNVCTKPLKWQRGLIKAMPEMSCEPEVNRAVQGW